MERNQTKQKIPTCDKLNELEIELDGINQCLVTSITFIAVMITLTQDLLKHRSIKRWPKKRTSHKWVTSKIFPLNVTNVWQFTRATPSMIGFILVLFSASNKKGPSDKVSFCFNASFFFVSLSLSVISVRYFNDNKRMHISFSKFRHFDRNRRNLVDGQPNW